MSKKLEAFDIFVDDIISSEENLLKGELDFLLMQHIFESLELDNLKDFNESFDSGDCTDSYLVAWKMFKFFYDNFWSPVFGKILSKFVFLIEGRNNSHKRSINKNQELKK